MACKYVINRDMLVLICDSCGRIDDIAKGQTDRLLANDYVHKNGWRTEKMNGKWIHLCPECKKAVEEKKRRIFLDRIK